MEKRIANPWSSQDQFGFVKANQVSGIQRSLIRAGQTSVDENGSPLNPGDMKAQLTQCLDNLETVLPEAGFKLSDVVHLNYYTTLRWRLPAVGRSCPQSQVCRGRMPPGQHIAGRGGPVPSDLLV